MKRNIIIALIVSVYLVGCQTVQMPTTFFANSPSEQLQELVDIQKNYQVANKLVSDYPNEILNNPGQDQSILIRLASGLNKSWNPRLKSASASLVGSVASKDWRGVKISIKHARDLTLKYPNTGVLSLEHYRSPLLILLKSDLEEVQQKLEEQAPAEFAKFNHFGSESFFNVYPVTISTEVFLKQNILSLTPFLESAKGEQIQRFTRNYPKNIFDKETWEILGGVFYKQALHGRGNLTPLAKLSAAQKLIDQGFSIPLNDQMKIAFVEATSKSLLRDGQIDFPISVDTDLVGNFTKISLNDALDPVIAAQYDLIIILDVILAKASRRVINMKNVRSSVFLGYGAMSSSEAESYISQSIDGEDDLDAPALPSMSGSGNKVAASEGTGSMTIFENSAVGAPITFSYLFQKARIQARKVMSTRYYIIDPKRKTIFKSLFDVSQEERFDVAYKISRYDPKKKKLINKYDTEKEVDLYEKDPSEVKLSSLLIHAKNSPSGMVPMKQAESLRRELLESRNKVLANYKANDFDDRSLNDPRFDSVVAVYKGKGGMGSGFFVKPDVVLTNWHVVEDSRYVEMRMYDGQETYGNVLGKDVRLDLALVKVQNRGRPVAFYTNKNLDTGIPVEAIGHPHRKLFSITRGIVSATRYEYSINLPSRAGDKVFYVQTDAPINPGNSGGPLFYKDKVIGVNTWGYKSKVADGLSFSVHYGEVLSFLNEHLPGFQTPLN